MCEEINLVDILRVEPEQMPEWLSDGPPFSFNREHFFSNRTLYYPGSGTDGQPVSLGSRSHAIHTFVYVDYLKSREQIIEALHGPHSFAGYIVEHSEDVKEEDLRPRGWQQHATPRNSKVDEDFIPFALMVILKRKEDRNENYGPERLAILFVGGDGFATYDALYCQYDGTPAPYLVVLLDHGFGANYDRFGRDNDDNPRLLEQIAMRKNVFPRWLLVGEPTNPWGDYEFIESNPEYGGMGNTERYLYRRIDINESSRLLER